ncbi:unnamed protein product [Eretmochelys imbricata]
MNNNLDLDKGDRAQTLFSPRWITENTTEFQGSLAINSVDFQKAFNRVNRETMRKIVEQYGIPTKLSNIMQAFYANSKCCIKMENGLSKLFSIKTGVRQGYVLSPFLFMLVIDYVLKQCDSSTYGLKWNNSRLSDLDFADDIALINANGLQKCTNQVNEVMEKMGLKYNAKKCKVMLMGTIGTEIKIEEKLEKVDNVTYLGNTISQDGTSSKGRRRRRIGKANAAFGRLKNIWQLKNISLKTKLNVYKAIVIAITTYSSETWQLTKKDTQKLDTFHHKRLRRILGIIYRDRKTNEEVRKITEQGTLSQIIYKRRQ